MTANLGLTSPVTIKGGIGDGPEGGCSEQIGVRIDKIQIRLDFTSWKAPEYIQIMDWARSVREHEFGNKHRVWRVPGIPQTCVSQELDGGGTLFIRFGNHRGDFKAWIEFNPNKVDIAEVSGHLLTMLENGMCSLVTRGVVAYCEFAIDVPNAKIEDYVFISRTHRQQNLGWIDQGTIYIGSLSHGELSFCIYDKQKQLREAEGKVVDHPLLRIEARISGKRRFPLNDILKEPSPFSSLLVMRRGELEQFIADGFLGDVLSVSGAPHELQYQLKGLQERRHKKPIIDRLSEIEVEWWKPYLLWGRLEASLGWLQEGLSYYIDFGQTGLSGHQLQGDVLQSEVG